MNDTASVLGETLPEHPHRGALARELHARPFTPIAAPHRVSHLAMVNGEGGAAADRAHLARLCQRIGAPPPADDASHHLVEAGSFRLKWERHTEFSSYTVLRAGAFADPFGQPALAAVPADWLRALPGEVLVAIHLALEPADAPDRDAEALIDLFGSDGYAAAEVAGGKAAAWSDFRLHGDGFGRILVRDRGLGQRQAGRLLQRLAEIETYRTMALLALPVAQAMAPRITAIDAALADIMARLASLDPESDEQALLDRLTQLAAETERMAAESSFRFGAARAYHALVDRRMEELREQRIEGLQTISEFLDRRFAPAMRTCEAVARRLEALTTRIARASNLLRTRVDVALERQNRDLLHSMDRRAKLQLRLQETVEGLSVAAISYYLVSLIGYGAKALAGAGLPLDPNLVMGAAILPVVAILWLGVRRIRRRVTAASTGHPTRRR